MSNVKLYSNPTLTVASSLIIIAVAMYASSIITPILLAFFISVVCVQPIRWLVKKHVPNGIAVFVVLLGILLLFVGLAEIIGASIMQFRQDLPEYKDRLHEVTASFFNIAHGMGFDISSEKLNNIVNPGKVMSFSIDALAELGSLMGNMFLIFFVVIFVLLEMKSYTVKLDAIVGSSEDTMKYLKRIGSSIRQYMGLMTIISLITGVLVWVALLIIGVKYAVLWAFLAFTLNYIPNIGSIVASIPAIMFAMIQVGTGGAIWTMGAFVVVNMVVGNIIQPQLMGKGLGLSTLVVFISLIFWGFIFGTIGMFLSVPLTMTIKVILEQNEKTKWMAIMLGTQEEAQLAVNKNRSQLDNS